MKFKIGVAEATAALAAGGWNFEEAARIIESERKFDEFTLQDPDKIARFEELKRNKPALFPHDVKVTLIEDAPAKKSEFVWSYKVNYNDPEYKDQDISYDNFKRLDDQFSD